MTTTLNRAGGAKRVLNALVFIKRNKDAIVGLAVEGNRQPTMTFMGHPFEIQLSSGICDMVGDLLGIQEAVIRHHLFDSFYESWDKFSGDFHFPVNEDPEIQGELFGMAEPDEMWDPSFGYAQMRWELLDHLINCLEREVVE